jgi:hypothetical protein
VDLASAEDLVRDFRIELSGVTIKAAVYVSGTDLDLETLKAAQRARWKQERDVGAANGPAAGRPKGGTLTEEELQAFEALQRGPLKAAIERRVSDLTRPSITIGGIRQALRRRAK